MYLTLYNVQFTIRGATGITSMRMSKEQLRKQDVEGVCFSTLEIGCQSLLFFFSVLCTISCIVKADGPKALHWYLKGTG